MQRVDFYKLTRPVQERFRGSVSGSGMPVPILEKRVGPREPLAWCGVSAAGVVALLVLYNVGYGSLASSIAIHPAALVALYFVFAATAVYGLLRAFALWRDTKRLPYRPGIYVFPIGLVDARRFTMRVYEMHDLVSADGPTPAGTFVLTFKGGQRFELPVKDPKRVELTKKALDDARVQHKEASEARMSVRPKALAAIDPLQDGGFASPLVPKTPIVRQVPFWASRSWIVAPACGFLLGIAIWNVRNVLSDHKMYAEARQIATASAYRAYLARGSRHADEISLVLLPRAELKEAIAAGSVDAMEAFVKAHPKTKIGPEIATALRTAMLADLEATKKAGTLTALQGFKKRHPDHHLDAELAKATHEVYVHALEGYEQSANPKDAAAVASVERMLAFLERAATNRVQVRFQRKLGKTIERADSAIAKSPSFMGGQSYVSRYFDANHAKPREADLAKTVTARFAEAFPADVLTVELGDPIDDPEAALPPANVPTIFVVHQVEWGGGLQKNDNPRGVFVSVGEQFDATVAVPGDSKPYKLHFMSWRGPNLDHMKGEEHVEDKVYGTMAKDCFDGFTKKLLAAFFKDPMPTPGGPATNQAATASPPQDQGNGATAP